MHHGRTDKEKTSGESCPENLNGGQFSLTIFSPHPNRAPKTWHVDEPVICALDNPFHQMKFWWKLYYKPGRNGTWFLDVSTYELEFFLFGLEFPALSWFCCSCSLMFLLLWLHGFGSVLLYVLQLIGPLSDVMVFGLLFMNFLFWIKKMK